MNFSTAGAAAYQTGQTGYAVTPTAATAATYTAQRAGTGYETAYQTAATHTTAGTYAGKVPFFLCEWHVVERALVTLLVHFISSVPLFAVLC